MKVAYTHSGVRGISSYCLNLHDGLAARGVDSLIVAEAKWSKEPRACVYEPDSVLLGGIMPFVTRAPQVAERLSAYAPDVLHHHHPSGRLDFFAESLRSRLDVPLVVTVHVSVHSNAYAIDRVMGSFFRLVRGKFRHAAAWVAISGFVRDKLLEVGGLSPDRIVLVRTGVDTELFHPVAKPERDTLEVLFVGQLMPEKGIGMLIDAVSAVARHRKIRLRILGSGNLESILRQRTAGQKEIDWLGYSRDRAHIAGLYADSDVVVMPTRWQEAFSYIPLEAMACGTAVIASDAGGTGEAVTNGDNGYLFPPGDTDRLTRLLRHADPRELAEMGRRGRLFVLARHTNELFARKHHELYRNVIEEPERIRQID